MFREPNITINGRTLDEGQAMTVRVAITSFFIELRDAETFRALSPIAPRYLLRLEEIIRMIGETDD
jgi:hypothetical protein